MKTEQGVNQRSLARAVRAQQSNRPAAQLAVQIAKNRTAAKSYRQPLQINNRRFAVRRLRGRDRFCVVWHSLFEEPAWYGQSRGHSRLVGTNPRINLRTL